MKNIQKNNIWIVENSYTGGNAKYDDNMEKTGYYSMYEILENKEILRKCAK